MNLYNFRLIFTQDQLSVSLCTTMLFFPVLYSVFFFDLKSLQSDICSSYSSDPLTITQLSKLSTSSNSLDFSTSLAVSTPTSSYWTLIFFFSIDLFMFLTLQTSALRYLGRNMITSCQATSVSLRL